MRSVGRALAAALAASVALGCFALAYAGVAWAATPVLGGAEVAAPVTLTRAPRLPGRATLLFLGDTGPGDAARPTLEARGLEHAFLGTIELLRGVDLAVANLEMPLTDGGAPMPLYKDYVYRAPTAAAATLAWAGIHVASLANNHATDQGDAGLVDTLGALEGAGVIALGAGQDEPRARRALVASVGDVKIGLLAYCEVQPLWALWVDQFARGTRPGVARLDRGALAEDVARLRPLVDVLVVSLHLGRNYAPPSAAALDWARRAADLGVDLVVAHHPHVAHPVLRRGATTVALSLGNYAFGTPGRPELNEGLMLFAEIEGRRLTRIELLPIDVQNRRVEFQPRPLAGAALDEALDRLVRESRALGAPLERVGDRAVLEVATR